MDSWLGWVIELELTFKSPPWELTFIVSEGAMQGAKGEKQLVDLPSCKAYQLLEQPGKTYMLDAAIVVKGQKDLWVTNSV